MLARKIQTLTHTRDIGCEVIRAEAKALEALIESMDHTFEDAITLILQHFHKNTSGRLIVSGVGKSGHIAGKLAATLASTGQPSFFVHPGEAGHGDLGMITRSDVLLLLSYSGEAKELHAMIDYARRHSIPIISITGKQDSVLARMSTVALLLPVVGEACPMGLAPTTSSTMTLALGDAIAITLLNERGFTSQDFKQFHPSGSLGQQLRQVSEFMHTGDLVPVVLEETGMRDVIEKMTHHGYGCVAVVDAKGEMCGIITDGDLRRHMSPSLQEQSAQDIMTRTPIRMEPDALLADAMAIFEKKAITALFITHDRKPIGVIRVLDCLRANVA